MSRWPKKETANSPAPQELYTSGMKVEFWMKAWLAYCQRTTVDFTKAKMWADQAVKDFEATFENAQTAGQLLEQITLEPDAPLPPPPTAVLQTPRPRPRPTATANAVPTGFPESETVSVKV